MSCISAIFASTSLSPSALAAAAFSSLARSFIAARSSAVNLPGFRPAAAVLLAGCCASFMAGSLPLRVVMGMTLMLGNDRRRAQGAGFPVISLMVTHRSWAAEVSMAAQTACAAAPSSKPGVHGAPGQPSSRSATWLTKLEP